MSIPLTPEQAEALDVARALASAGIPIFVAPPDPRLKIGFRLPQSWQDTSPDPRAVDAWMPGFALCAVMGRGLDLLDVDPHKGGDLSALTGPAGSDPSVGAGLPTSYGTAVTPSGGVHSLIASLDINSRDNVLPGVDVKAGRANGKGRGFAFIAPTVKPSKLTGQPGSYRWIMVPDISRLRAVLSGELVDDTGSALRELIKAARTGGFAPGTTNADNVVQGADEHHPSPDFHDMPADLQETVRGWLTGAIEGIRTELKASAGWAPGATDDRGRGWEKLQADAAMRLGSLARASWNDLELADAEAIFLDAAPVDGTWGTDDVALKWSQQHHRGEPAPWPGLRSPADRDAEAWAALGVQPPAPGPVSSGTQTPETGTGGAPAGPPSTPPSPDTVASRYFGPGGIQAATLAGDTLAFGPLRTGRDDLMWSYSSGVWSADKHAVRERLTRLLGQRFRTSFVGTVEAMIRANVDSITCDPVPEFINFTNGLLDWRANGGAGELRAHSPEVPSTVQLAVPYDADAQCSAFEDFVHQVVPEDVVPTIWELIGYLMFSGNPLHKAVMLTGSGRNGKGTFLRVIEAVLGARNVTSVSLHDLVNTRFTTASLFGKLANIAGDIDATYLENTATFKGITGGDTISAEHKGRDRFDFKPWAVPMFSANKIPASADTSVGYLARWLVVPFPNDFTGREDRHLDARLRTPAELQGIAARGVRALGTLLDRGDFELTASGLAAREEFVRRVDQVRTWLADCCDIHPEHPFVARTELYEAYKRWAGRDGHKPVRATEFYDRLEQAGGEPAKVMGTRGFKRIRVIDNGWATTGVMPLGAVGAQIPNPAQTGAQLGAQTLPTAPATAPTIQADAAGTVCAPSSAPSVSAGQPTNAENLGAVGAETPQPPYARVAQVGGLGDPAPTAPSSANTSPSTVTKPKREQSPEAKEAAAGARAEKRAAAIAEAVAAAGGPLHDLPALVLRDGSVTSVQVHEAAALLDTITGALTPGANVTGELTVDVENTGYPIGHRHYALRTVQLGNENLALVLDPTDAAQREQITLHVATARVLHAHSATADLIPLEVDGLLAGGIEEAWSRMHDTVTLAKLADPGSTKSAEGLKQLAPAVLGEAAVSPGAEEARSALFKAGRWLTETKPTTELERSGWAQVNPRAETMIRYAASDVLDDAAIARRLPYPEPHVWRREVLAQTMTARVAHTGLALDAEQVTRLQAEQRSALADAGARLGSLGVENPGSDAQVAAALEPRLLEAGLPALPRTPRGKPSVAKAGLNQYAALPGDLGELVRARLDYQTAENRLGLFLDGWHDAVTHGDGRVRPTVYTLEAKTGRMSCVRPNLQQVPRAGGFRACITADPGHVLISADFAQVELRVAAALSRDRDLIAILDDPNRDIHREIAQIVWGPAAGKAERYQAKRKVFGRIYGSGINGLVTADPPVSEPIARAIVAAMDHMTPGLTAWSRRTADQVEAGLRTYQAHSGRIIHMPAGRAYAAPNYCIQGEARELLIDALERWATTRWGRCPVLPVHDEIVSMVPEDDAEEATAVLVECMATVLDGVRIVAEASEPSRYWRDSE